MSHHNNSATSADDEKVKLLTTLSQTDVITPLPLDVAGGVLGSAPFVALAGTFNARDLGLLPGSPIKPGVVYRSGGFFMLGNDEDEKDKLAKELRALGVERIVDLRSVREHEKSPDPVLEGVEGVWERPLEEEAGVEDFLGDFEEGEGEREGAGGGAGGEGGGGGVLFHCTAGRDRTGVMAGILLVVAGAGGEVVELDWMLSRVGTEVAREELLGFAMKGAGVRDLGVEVRERKGFYNLVSLRVGC
ncbi:protein-tyrosine phosphatase-like protein [Apiosordaria backusii]|uniref:Protein-tyrosine phosphatase-like protein n=1 Tax=Apiosordaria backusii TaxID=314023 RepID=A0AA40ETH5_9PEZI|nr:protein-tyrosine phosphatase-like protein [Apiosordaria backusii]